MNVLLYQKVDGVNQDTLCLRANVDMKATSDIRSGALGWRQDRQRKRRALRLTLTINSSVAAIALVLTPLKLLNSCARQLEHYLRS